MTELTAYVTQCVAMSRFPDTRVSTNGKRK